ncbi:MAG TPA: hypothetical protein VKT49_05355 [Bryobacteraceae bacterium]|nr:hypothetical protein [Bryobacteraceae bacterium]
MQAILAQFGRPAQFPASARADFAPDQTFILAPWNISQAQPREVKDFVDENAGELTGAAVEGDPPFPHESSGVDRPMQIAESRMAVNPDRPTRQWR